MNDEMKNGGPAFPRTEKGAGGTGDIVYFGMSLRDYFAAKAMASLIRGAMDGGDVYFIGAVGKIPSAAYTIADAMLKERAK